MLLRRPLPKMGKVPERLATHMQILMLSFAPWNHMKPRNWLGWLSLAKGVIFRFHHVPSTFSTEHLFHCHYFLLSRRPRRAPFASHDKFLGRCAYPDNAQHVACAGEDPGIHHGVCCWYHCITVHPSIRKQSPSGKLHLRSLYVSTSFTFDCMRKKFHQGKTCERAAIRTRGSIPTIDSELKYGGVWVVEETSLNNMCCSHQSQFKTNTPFHLIVGESNILVSPS